MKKRLKQLGDANSSSLVYADLGSTNTGKTHRAIERMLTMKSGIIGLPLRLLAREVYDKLCARISPQYVALLTGEEKIIPDQARYYICTVESMPMDKAVQIIIIDEIQLAAHPKRGHTFTDRLLHARGLQETWLLGSDTMSEIIETLLPTAIIHKHHRLSQLRYVEPKRLANLPKRTALISFNINHLYEIAERIRISKGGVAIVMGSMSPQARNSQVELFQSGAVDYIVATDAIGLGLNLDLKHVCFASLRKFDGREDRNLTWAEIGQIAGRAGRFEESGTFSLSMDASKRFVLPDVAIESIEQQIFPPVRKIYYRNSNLSFASLDHFWNSLQKAPFAWCLTPQREALDENCMRTLVQDPEILPTLFSANRIELLWKACQIPDYAQSTTPNHIRFIKKIYQQLITDGVLSPVWISKSIERLANTNYDIPHLLRQMDEIRAWGYITYRSDWIDKREYWQQHIRTVEDELSNTVHQKLLQRFIDEFNSPNQRQTPIDIYVEGEELWCSKMQLGYVQSFSFQPNFEASQIFGYGILRSLGNKYFTPIAQQLCKEMLQERKWHITPHFEISWRGHCLAKIEKGLKIREPKLGYSLMELLDSKQRQHALMAIQDWLQQEISAFFALYPTATDSSKTIRFELRQNLGSLVKMEHPKLTPDQQQSLRKSGIIIGKKYIYHKDVFKTKHQQIRFLLYALENDLPQIPELPLHHTCGKMDWPKGMAKKLGYAIYCGYTIRADVVDKMYTDKDTHTRLSRLGLPKQLAEPIIQAMNLP